MHKPPTSVKPANSPNTRRRRWWRWLAVSAVVQLLLVVAWWRTWAVHHQHSPNAEAGLTSISVNTVSSSSVEPDALVRQPPSVPPALLSPTSTDKHSRQRTIENHGAQPLSATQASAYSAEKSAPLSRSAALTNKTDNSVAHEANSASLFNAPIPLQTLTYRSSISDGQQEVTLPPTRLTVSNLGEQRFAVSLSNGTGNKGEGNFGLRSRFLATEQGPQPLEISGGAYFRTPDNVVQFRSGLGLTLNKDGIWAFNHVDNRSARSEANFVDRASLIVYLQGALSAGRIHPPQKIQLPIAQKGAVRLTEVVIDRAVPKDLHCQPCTHAEVHANLGEMRHWQVWYDGSRDWKPVQMQMNMGGQRQWVLTLSLD